MHRNEPSQKAVEPRKPIEEKKPIEQRKPREEKTEATASNVALSQEEKKSKVAMTVGQKTTNNKVMCPILPVKIKVKGSFKCVVTYMAMDSHCKDVFMSSGLAQKIGIKGRVAQIPLTTLGHKNELTNTMVVNNLEISDLDENESANIPVAYTQDPWPYENEDSPSAVDLEAFLYLKKIPFKYVKSKIGLLVGMNHPAILRPLEILCGPSQDSPYATRHKFGWAFNGPTSEIIENKKSCVRVRQKHDIDQQFQMLCANEFSDADSLVYEPSIEDQRWSDIVNKTLKQRSDGLFEVELPFREDDPEFSNNRNQVLDRLISNKKKIFVYSEYYQEYCEFMQMMLQRAYAEEVPEDELQKKPGQIWYLVHFGVRHKQKKKLRIVFDASLKYKGVSLNQKLLQGPDMANNLMGVLLRAREENILVTADIEKMFYSVKVADKHKDFLRFFWYPENDFNKEPIEYRVTVHIFGATSFPAIANYLLKYSAQKEDAKTKFSEESRVSVNKNFYVDDWLKSVKTEATAIKIVDEVSQLVARVGFKLTSYTSNSRNLLSKIDPEILAKNLKNFCLAPKEELPTERTLGVMWNMENDNIEFSINLPVKQATKRGVLATVFSIYDVLGLVSPAILPAKRIFQLACNDKIDWDVELTTELKMEWDTWLKNINMLSEFKIPRRLKPNNAVKSVELHLFCVSSERAFAAVVYFCK